MSIAPDPDVSLQRFDRMRRYFRDGRAPWRILGDEVQFLATGGASSPRDRQTTAREFGDALRKRFHDDLLIEATEGLAHRNPQASARSVRPRAVPTAVLATAFLAAATLVWPRPALQMLSVVAAAAFVMLAFVRLALMAIAACKAKPAPRQRLSERELPVVTILTPLFREAHALPGLVRAIDLLDYPTSKLDVKLLLEEADGDTIAEVRRLGLLDRFDVIIAPPSEPQTKPKACNYGLHCAQGDLIVIYDAEDEPEPDQLRVAAETFAAGPENLACVQAKLNFYNPEENWLTRLFTLEYCLWFDHLLPALDRIGAPVPLGGTSNIFRTDVLVEAGGWDPHNVTEDADLGLRLARLGYRTAIIDSTTFEEANCRLGNWLRQRTRWMKGFLQTWLVHRRDMRFAGWRGVLTVDLFVGGAAFAALANPIIWLSLAASAAFPELYPPSGKSADLVATAAIFGNAAFLASAAFAPLKRGLGRLSPAAFLVPAYWLMISIAAWRGFLQLLTRPSFWEKTDHGISVDAKARRAAALQSMGLD